MHYGTYGTNPPTPNRNENDSPSVNIIEWRGKMLGLSEGGLPTIINPDTFDFEGHESFGGVVPELFGSRVPSSPKVFVSALAVTDDLGAIIIALFYSSGLQFECFIYAGIILALLIGLNRGRIYSRTPYFILGIFLWFFVHESGLHSTLAGILLAAIIPARKAANVADIAAQTSAIMKHELNVTSDEEAKNNNQIISSFSIANLYNAVERLRDPGSHVEYT